MHRRKAARALLIHINSNMKNETSTLNSDYLRQKWTSQLTELYNCEDNAIVWSPYIMILISTTIQSLTKAENVALVEIRGVGAPQWRSPPPKLLVVNFPINLRCYVLLGCRVINVILAINIGDSAFWFNCWLRTCTLWLHMGLDCHMTKSYKAVDTLAPPPPPQTKILATPLAHLRRLN